MPDLELATQDDFVFNGGGRADVGLAFERAKEAHVSVLRINAMSSDVSAHGWGRLDALVDNALAHGLIPQVTLMGRPRWYEDGPGALPDGGCPRTDPNPGRYAAWCRRAVGHFGDRVNRYSIWNEPNHPTFLACTTESPTRRYARLYLAGLHAIRETPHKSVYFGEIAGGAKSRTWVHEALLHAYKLNRGKAVDCSGFAIHPYQYTTAPDTPSTDDALRMGDMPYLADYLQRTRTLATTLDRPCPLYITEMGWFNEPHKLAVSEDTRADWVTQSIAMCRDLDIRQFLYYTLFKSPSQTGGWDTGLVDLDGRTGSSFAALRQSFG